MFLPLLLSAVATNIIFEWGSRATRYLPNETALDHTYAYDGDVLIIGAGSSGLAAARVLEENGIRYTVLEATDRYGGRLMEDATFAEFPCDLGAEWIHNLPGVLDVLSGVEGTANQTELVPYRMEDAAVWNGRRLSKTSALVNDFVFRFFPESKFKRSTWFEFVRHHLAEKVEHRIQYNSPVTEVDYSGERVQVTTASGEQFVADRVLVTVSVGVLRSGDVAFVPGLSQQKKEALASVGFPPGFKMLLKFSEKFYPDAVSVESDDGSGGEKTFYDMAFKKDSPDNVLGFLVTGAGAIEQYYSLESDDQILAAVLEELDEIFGGAATRNFAGEYRLEDWGRKEYTKGTWVEGFDIEPSTLAVLNAPLEQKVYFAGEAHDVNRQLGVPGAVLSGYDAADLMLR